MNRRPRDCHVAEWAELVGERVPESAVASDASEDAGDEAR